jgi:hypothetical protein
MNPAKLFREFFNIEKRGGFVLIGFTIISQLPAIFFLHICLETEGGCTPGNYPVDSLIIQNCK